MGRDVRYQGAIVRDDHLLLIRHRMDADGRTFWIFPGGGLEPGESPEDCVRREMKEETDLDVRVSRLALDVPEPAADSPYRRLKTYLCEPLAGEAKAGFEPEIPERAATSYAIVAVGWFNLRDESAWDPEMCSDPYTYPQVQQLRQALGYLRPG